MTEQIVIQETRVMNGAGERKFPIYFSTVQIPKELYNNKVISIAAYRLMDGAQNSSNESSEIIHHPSSNYGTEVFTIMTPDIEHTRRVTTAILEGFGLDAEITDTVQDIE